MALCTTKSDQRLATARDMQGHAGLASKPDMSLRDCRHMRPTQSIQCLGRSAHLALLAVGNCASTDLRIRSGGLVGALGGGRLC